MNHSKSITFFICLALIFLICSSWASGQIYPNKPITINVGFGPGGSTDVVMRVLAKQAEKILDVPIIVVDKSGGGSTVAASLVSTKKSDGYELASISSGALVLRPHVLKLPYNPLEDFTYIMSFSVYTGGLIVRNDHPSKTIKDFIDYAKLHPGLSYGTAGMFTHQHISTELFAKCKGLTFKHLPYKGGNDSNTALLGGHLDFSTGAGSHIPYIRAGLFRMLYCFGMTERDPNFPNVPTLKELSCEDAAPLEYIIVGPRGIPESVTKKLDEVFRKVMSGPSFQESLVNFNLPYKYKSREQLEREIPKSYELYKGVLELIK